MARRSRTGRAAGIINGMGSVGSVVQELVLGAVFAKGELRLIFAAPRPSAQSPTCTGVRSASS